MQPAQNAYRLGALAVAVSKVATVVAGAVSLWMLTQILSKDMFGGYVFVMSLVTVVGLLATVGLDRALLLRVSPIAPSEETLHGRGLMMRAAVTALASGIFLAFALHFAAGSVPRLGTDTASAWLPVLSIIVPVAAVAEVLRVWFQANHRVAVAFAMPGLVDACRCLLFAAILALGLGAPGVAWAAVAAATLPILVLAILARKGTVAAPARLRFTDIGAGLQFLTLRLANLGFRNIDIIMVGLYTSAAATGEYGIAARLAVLVEFGAAALLPTFTPRVRRHLATGERETAQEEFHVSRAYGLAIALAGAAFLTLFGPMLLSLFGDFHGAYRPMLILTAVYVVSSGFGMHATYLAMAGELAASTAVRIASLALLVAALRYGAPAYGTAGAATAVLVSTLVLNGLGAAVATVRTGLKVIDLVILAVLAVAAACLLGVAFDVLAPAVGGGALACCCLAVCLRDRRVMIGWLRR